MGTYEPQSQPTKNHRATWFWGGFVVLLLSIQVVGGIAMAVIATNDPSFAVVPNYHDKAMRWDESVAKQRQSDELKWQVKTDLSERLADSDFRRLSVTLRDAQSQLILDAQVNARLFHHARASEVINAKLAPITDGVYVSELSMPREGIWQLELTAERSETERFLLSRTLSTLTTRPAALAQSAHSPRAEP